MALSLDTRTGDQESPTTGTGLSDVLRCGRTESLANGTMFPAVKELAVTPAKQRKVSSIIHPLSTPYWVLIILYVLLYIKFIMSLKLKGNMTRGTAWETTLDVKVGHLFLVKENCLL